MKRTMRYILEHQDELAQKFEDFEPDPVYDWGPGNLGVREILCSGDHEQSEGEPCPVCRACL